MDEYAGKDYSHRKAWVIERLAQLSSVFAIDLCAYAVMSNHYHLVLHVDQRRAKLWSAQEVIDHWAMLFSCPPLVDRWRQGLCGTAERDVAEAMIERWRGRLCDVSWYMRCLNEHLARRANAEDQCTGRFWEGRFKSQALLDEAGLLTAMAYVDLNPVRAGMAATPEASDFTSIEVRLRAISVEMKDEQASSSSTSGSSPAIALLAFADRAADAQRAIPCRTLDYLELVDWTGRAIRDDKRGSIDHKLPSILSRLNIDRTAWQQAMQCNPRAISSVAPWGGSIICDCMRACSSNRGFEGSIRRQPCTHVTPDLRTGGAEDLSARWCCSMRHSLLLLPLIDCLVSAGLLSFTAEPAGK